MTVECWLGTNWTHLHTTEQDWEALKRRNSDSTRNVPSEIKSCHGFGFKTKNHGQRARQLSLGLQRECFRSAWPFSVLSTPSQHGIGSIFERILSIYCINNRWTMHRNRTPHQSDHPLKFALYHFDVCWQSPTEHRMTDQPSSRLVVHKTVTEFVVQLKPI